MNELITRVFEKQGLTMPELTGEVVFALVELSE